MKYAHVVNGVVIGVLSERPIGGCGIEGLSAIGDDQLITYGYYPIVYTNEDTHHEYQLVDTNYNVLSDRVEATYIISNMSAEQKIFDLWTAATKYQELFISGMASVPLAVGMMLKIPKALAITNWINAVWTEYYARQYSLQIDTNPNLDFSIVGPMPHSVPELLNEVAVATQ
jgi:hypothetical protein